MSNQHSAAANGRFAQWNERKQDFLMVSAFGLWAAVLGLLPAMLLRMLTLG